jgi:methyltransferase-like protein
MEADAAKILPWMLYVQNKFMEVFEMANETVKKFDTVGFIMAYEDGQLEDEEIIEGFQELINSGLAWSLQGSYGRMAATLIDHGHCTRVSR